MKKRLIVAALALSLVASACGGDDDDNNAAPDAQSGPTTTAAPVRGGTIVVAISSDPGSLNPAVTSNGGVHTASEMMFNGLVGWGADGKPTPELAESWTIEGNGTAYNFKLRPGVKWHDGRDFTSDDVKFSFERALLRLHSRTQASLGSAQVALETPNPTTVIFRFPNPYAPLLQQLNVTEAPIIPKHIYEGCTDLATVAGCPANKTPVGTGPFKLESYTVQEIKMVRNPTYFRAGQPYLDGMTQRVIPDPGTQLLALENREIDWVGSVPGPDIERVKANRALGTATSPRGSGGGNCTTTMIFNMKPPEGRTPFFADLRTRQAVWHAINREQAFRTVSFGQGKVSAAPINSGITFATATGLNLPTFDANRSKTLLDQAGWKDEGGGARTARGVANVPDGTRFEIDWHGFAGDQTTYGEQIRSQLTAVGITLQVKTEDNATFSRNVFAQRQFDTGVASYCNGDDPEIGFRRQVDSRQISTTAFSNGAGYSNPDVDRLLDTASREPDPAKRTPIYRQLQEQLVRDLPYVWLTESAGLRAFNASCTGFNHENTGLFAEAASCKK
ncbi:MAG: ABC transporter, substrate-binding protein (cluster 5, nickel/peptides/opines) [uncultured Acidimicrobiales bacterium]|uniref:ABC transporter, substrate-binding protein (Cluster 5, nickel/peptides/opines) n=1 Tax=uncultured Acidimicrobiales bacterium TaxID=310071 RepID=A0A6J4JFW5_9ACTN|nr:MAG: ABC transporter, substrate-binding protein (cluster 5, nickel/peptides/opines) [uncultured Acidimicrobiales bacterium]